MALNVAAAGAVTLWLLGCRVNAAAMVAALTVSVAALLVMLPALLLTTTRNCCALSASTTAVRVSVALLAPAIFAKLAPLSVLRCHWLLIEAPEPAGFAA